jgi:hypothetical protein
MEEAAPVKSRGRVSIMGLMIRVQLSIYQYISIGFMIHANTFWSSGTGIKSFNEEVSAGSILTCVVPHLCDPEKGHYCTEQRRRP